MSFSFRTVLSCVFRSPCASSAQYSTLWEVIFGTMKILGAMRGFSFSFPLVVRVGGLADRYNLTVFWGKEPSHPQLAPSSCVLSEEVRFWRFCCLPARTMMLRLVVVGVVADPCDLVKVAWELSDASLVDKNRQIA
jgi:hypothetical protein